MGPGPLGPGPALVHGPQPGPMAPGPIGPMAPGPIGPMGHVGFRVIGPNSSVYHVEKLYIMVPFPLTEAIRRAIRYYRDA